MNCIDFLKNVFLKIQYIRMPIINIETLSRRIRQLIRIWVKDWKCTLFSAHRTAFI